MPESQEVNKELRRCLISCPFINADTGEFLLLFFFFLNPNLIGVPHGGSPCRQVTHLKHWPPAPPKAEGAFSVFRFPRESWQPTGHLGPSSRKVSTLGQLTFLSKKEASFLLLHSSYTCSSPILPGPFAAAGSPRIQL